MKTTWFDEEPRFVDVVRQAAALFVRGVRRPFVALSFALLQVASESFDLLL